MEAIDEEFLSLKLAIVSDDNDFLRNKKRKMKEGVYPLYLSDACQLKVFSLLQMREQMMKIDNQKGKGVVNNENGLKLIHLLLVSATSIDEKNVNMAMENLRELYKHVSLTGDSVQRVTAYFTDGLVSRILTQNSPFYDMIMKEPTLQDEFLAFMEFYHASPYYQFAHFTANQAIIEAFDRDVGKNNNTLHVIDFDISYGFQWPSLIQSISEKGTSMNQIYLRITGYGRSYEELQETERRLVGFAKGVRNLTFEFHGLLMGSILQNLKKQKNETVAINMIFQLNASSSPSKIYEKLKSFDLFNPSIIVLIEQGGSRIPRSFISRFTDSLHFFAAMFDSLDDCLPIDSVKRLNIERHHLGKEIKSMINYEKSNCSFGKYEKMETWKGWMDNHGFVNRKLSSKSILQAKLLIKIRGSYCPTQLDGETNGGFRVLDRDDGKAISLAWQDRCLITASTWESRL